MLEEGAILISLQKEIHQNIPLQMAAKRWSSLDSPRGCDGQDGREENHSIITTATITREGEIAWEMSARKNDAVQTLTIDQQWSNQQQPSLLKKLLRSRSPYKRYKRIQKVSLKKMITIIIIEEGASDRVGQMTTCVGISLPFCRSTVRRAGRRGREREIEREGGGGVVSSFRLYFFCSCIRWIQSRAHELSSLFGSVRPPRPARSLSPRSQLEQTRALHVTSRPLQYKQLRDAPGGLCVCM